jgi:transcriptional regulator with XRE-family HTH domain
VIAELAAYVAPGGFLAAAVRTTTSALWRPAARQDWQAALAAFDEHDRALAEGRDMRYINEIGAPARADNLDALTTLATAYGLQLENWYGVRITVDPDELDPTPPSDPRQLAEFARRTGLTTKHVNQVMQGVASLSAEVAQRLEYATGTPSWWWPEPGRDRCRIHFVCRGLAEGCCRGSPPMNRKTRSAGSSNSWRFSASPACPWPYRQRRR